MPKTGGAVAKSESAGQKASSGKADPLVADAKHFDTGPGFSLDQFKAAKFYQAQGYHDLNAHLRGILPAGPLDQAHIPHLERLINLSTTNKNLTLYRGIEAFAGFKPSQLKAGSVIEDKGFFSTSLKKSAAEGFASGISESVVLSIAVPKGTRALPVFRLGTGSSFQASEREVLLQHGTKVRIKSVRKGKDGVYRAKAELIQ